MPTDNISQALKESYAQANSADVYLETIEVFPDTADTIPFTGSAVGAFDWYHIAQTFESGTSFLSFTGTLTI